jgi:hypothetical protein
MGACAAFYMYYDEGRFLGNFGALSILARLLFCSLGASGYKTRRAVFLVGGFVYRPYVLV